MMRKHQTMADSPRGRLETIDRRIARMRSLNTDRGDLFALRLIEHAETERRRILAHISAADRKPE
jgi:hypothetical protein